MDEIEAKIIEMVKEKHKRTGGCNGLSFNDLAGSFEIDFPELRKIIDKLVSEKKIAYLNHLNGRSLTLPK
ncbi:hypothetical protein [Chryseobacterium taichungense]|uniref:hypothetical protein n=1 Tax=Chryseobacterium taichungense TaxID=295069 RepID=UPI0028ADCE20|nr:hypothetical protein [Chryseobacterium taichungense]